MKKNSIIHFGLMLYAAIFFTSCNDPLHRTYNPVTYEEDIQEIRKSNKVSDEDLQLLTKYIMLTKLSGNDITGKTYGDIIDKIKSFQQNNSDVNSRASLEKDTKRKRLSPFLEVTLQGKTFEKKDAKDVLVFTVLLKNTGTQKIKMIVGNLTINDLMEKPVKSVSIILDEDILPGQAITKKYTSDYNEGDESDRRMRSKDFFDIRAIWDPEKIIFENGRLLE